MAKWGYVWLSRAMWDDVRLYTLLLVTNGEPLYDAYTILRQLSIDHDINVQYVCIISFPVLSN